MFRETKSIIWDVEIFDKDYHDCRYGAISYFHEFYKYFFSETH